MKAKKWTVRYLTEDGSSKYESVIGNDLQKVVAYLASESGIDLNAIDYMCAEECIVVE
jgi:hypothetical protein